MSKYPNHIAIIMDGNGRWANQKNKPRIFGHRMGVQRVREIVEFCRNSKYIDISFNEYVIDNLNSNVFYDTLCDFYARFKFYFL